MTPSAEIIRTTDLPQFGAVYFGLRNQYKVVLTRCGHRGSTGPHANFTAKFFEKKQFCHFILHAQTYQKKLIKLILQFSSKFFTSIFNINILFSKLGYETNFFLKVYYFENTTP